VADTGAGAILGESAATHPHVSRREVAGAVVYESAGRPFVALTGARAEFRLRPEMVRAALRTPGTGASQRGPEWVAFEAPAELERYDVDRLRAWFEMAARLAQG
jgi:hypothetical protein